MANRKKALLFIALLLFSCDDFGESKVGVQFSDVEESDKNNEVEGIDSLNEKQKFQKGDIKAGSVEDDSSCKSYFAKGIADHYILFMHEDDGVRVIVSPPRHDNHDHCRRGRVVYHARRLTRRLDRKLKNPADKFSSDSQENGDATSRNTKNQEENEKSSTEGINDNQNLKTEDLKTESVEESKIKVNGNILKINKDAMHLLSKREILDYYKMANKHYKYRKTNLKKIPKPTFIAAPDDVSLLYVVDIVGKTCLNMISNRKERKVLQEVAHEILPGIGMRLTKPYPKSIFAYSEKKHERKMTTDDEFANIVDDISKQKTIDRETAQYCISQIFVPMTNAIYSENLKIIADYLPYYINLIQYDKYKTFTITEKVQILKKLIEMSASKNEIFK